jgi:Arc/MetJ-type ribon-helix-helix transcriptional regulator
MSDVNHVWQILNTTYPDNRNIGESYMTENEYSTVKLPNDLIAEVDTLVGTHGFKTRAEVVKEAIRKFLREYKKVDVKSKEAGSHG